MLPKEATGVGICSGTQASAKPEPGEAREHGAEFKDKSNYDDPVITGAWEAEKK